MNARHDLAFTNAGEIAAEAAENPAAQPLWRALAATRAVVEYGRVVQATGTVLARHRLSCAHRPTLPRVRPGRAA
jgi:hypothetical protein